MLKEMRSLGKNGQRNINPDFFSTLEQEMLCCVLYLKKSIPEFTASEAPNGRGTP